MIIEVLARRDFNGFLDNRGDGAGIFVEYLFPCFKRLAQQVRRVYGKSIPEYSSEYCRKQPCYKASHPLGLYALYAHGANHASAQRAMSYNISRLGIDL
jgi:hypothetical protein